MKIKTIDIIAKEWFDKINGNSYFSAQIIINYGLKNIKMVQALKIPFTYGYGEQYIFESGLLIAKEFNLNLKESTLWRYCEDNNIILRTHKQKNCLKGDL